jgi:transcriptional regulator with XRE-family HTH domain
MPEPVVARTHELRQRPLLRVLLGGVLRGVRREQGRTLADVARTARISMPYLSELERGRKEASSEVLAAVCEALRIELADVLAEVGRTLAADRVRRPAVVRPGAGTFRPRAARPAGPGDALCLAA